MDSSAAKALFSRLIANTKRPASGQVQLDAEDITNVRAVVSEIIRLSTAGSRSYWGPRLVDCDYLCHIILTEDQLSKKGSKKAEVAKAILDALPSAEAVSQAVGQSSSRKRPNVISEEEEFLAEQLDKCRSKKKAKTVSIGRAVTLILLVCNSTIIQLPILLELLLILK